MRAEAERACRRLAAVPDFLVDAVTDRALSPANSVLLTVPQVVDEPRELRRADGPSVYEGRRIPSLHVSRGPERRAAHLVVSKDFIYDEVRHGRLRASRIARQLRFRPADVDAFVEANAVTGSDL